MLNFHFRVFEFLPHWMLWMNILHWPKGVYCHSLLDSSFILSVDRVLKEKHKDICGKKHEAGVLCLLPWAPEGGKKWDTKLIIHTSMPTTGHWKKYGCLLRFPGQQLGWTFFAGIHCKGLCYHWETESARACMGSLRNPSVSQKEQPPQSENTPVDSPFILPGSWFITFTAGWNCPL